MSEAEFRSMQGITLLLVLSLGVGFAAITEGESTFF